MECLLALETAGTNRSYRTLDMLNRLAKDDNIDSSAIEEWMNGTLEKASISVLHTLSDARSVRTVRYAIHQ